MESVSIHSPTPMSSPWLSRPCFVSSLSFDAFWAQGEVEAEESQVQGNRRTKSNQVGRESPHVHFSVARETSNNLFYTSSAPGSELSTQTLPTSFQVSYACSLPVFDEKGRRVLFGEVLASTADPSLTPLARQSRSPHHDKITKTVVCFIRHFMCPLCQDYMYSIARTVDPEALSRAGLRLVVVGNGAWEMIKGYRRIFKFPFPVYTDPTTELYKALGMTLRTGSQVSTPSNSVACPTVSPSFTSPLSSSSFATTTSCPSADFISPFPSSYSMQYTSPASSQVLSPEAQLHVSSPPSSTKLHSYVRHRSLLSGIPFVIRNAVKARMPLWRYMGDKTILGGEFVFECPPKDQFRYKEHDSTGIRCVWAHRMQYPTGHKEIGEVIGYGVGSEVDMGMRMDANGEKNEGTGVCAMDGCNIDAPSIVSISTLMGSLASLGSFVSPDTRAPEHPRFGFPAGSYPSSDTIHESASVLQPSSIPHPEFRSDGYEDSVHSQESASETEEEEEWLKLRRHALRTMHERKNRRRLFGYGIDRADARLDERDDWERSWWMSKT